MIMAFTLPPLPYDPAALEPDYIVLGGGNVHKLKTSFFFLLTSSFSISGNKVPLATQPKSPFEALSPPME